ncbi:MAG: hypothetical protein QOE14_1697 [Humisphaera sp.]|nr:hypothetical protein [Humisphaera sp.]
MNMRRISAISNHQSNEIAKPADAMPAPRSVPRERRMRKSATVASAVATLIAARRRRKLSIRAKWVEALTEEDEQLRARED